MNKDIPQHKRMAMGDKTAGCYAKGGAVRQSGSSLLKTGTPDTPLEDAKRANGLVGMKTGGKVKK